MKTDGKLLAKCIKDEAWGTGKTNLVIDSFYVVDEVWIGQSHSIVKINGQCYNSIMFEYYDNFMKPINIYKEYIPTKEGKK